ncbi:MAG: hypothetical protein K1T65_09425, partial [Candidatus Aramenus sp.]|nr:hypothetical protein [Candidatus Aramenus sp.]
TYERFKDFLREINDIADFYYTHSFYETLAYIIRERARHKQFADFLEILLEDYVNTKKTEGADGFRLLDLYFVLKNYETGYGEEMK